MVGEALIDIMHLRLGRSMVIASMAMALRDASGFVGPVLTTAARQSAAGDVIIDTAAVRRTISLCSTASMYFTCEIKLRLKHQAGDLPTKSSSAARIDLGTNPSPGYHYSSACEGDTFKQLWRARAFMRAGVRKAHPLITMFECDVSLCVARWRKRAVLDKRSCFRGTATPAAATNQQLCTDP